MFISRWLERRKMNIERADKDDVRVKRERKKQTKKIVERKTSENRIRPYTWYSDLFTNFYWNSVCDAYIMISHIVGIRQWPDILNHVFAFSLMVPCLGRSTSITDNPTWNSHDIFPHQKNAFTAFNLSFLTYSLVYKTTCFMWHSLHDTISDSSYITFMLK